MSTITPFDIAMQTGSLADYLLASASQKQSNADAEMDGASADYSSANKLQTASLLAAKKLGKAYGGGVTSDVGQKALQCALSELSGLVNGKVTFALVAEYRQSLEVEFSTKARSELHTLGVALDQTFDLTMTPEGKLQVSCDDPAAKEKIQAYLKNSPKMCEQFGYIQALANLDRAKQSSTVGAWQGLHDTKAQIQAGSLEAFFGEALSSTMTYSSLTASFGVNASSEISFYTGLDFIV